MKRRRSRPIQFKADRRLKYGPPKPVLITAKRFQPIDAVMDRGGHRLMVQDIEGLKPPAGRKEFAREVISIIASSRLGMAGSDAIYRRCLRALERGKSTAAVYRHGGKTTAMDYVWDNRQQLFKAWRRLRDDHDRVRFCGKLPWIGRMSRFDLAQNLGADVARPTKHLLDLADIEGRTVWDMCHQLAKQSGYREATVGMILTEACSQMLLEPIEIWCYDWKKGTDGLALGARCKGLKFV